MPTPLHRIREVSEAFFRYTDVDAMIRQTLHAALDAIGAEAGSVMLADSASHQLVFHYVLGENASILKGTGIPWDKGIAGAVFASGEPEIIPAVQADARHYRIPEAQTGYRPHDMIVVPLKRHGGSPIGVIEILNKTTGAIGREDVDLLVVISAIAAAAIEQSKAFETLRVKDLQLQQAQKMEAVGRLAGGVAHDFNNLLTVIRGYGELLSAAVHDDRHLSGHVDEVLKAAERASSLTSQLLAFSRKQIVAHRPVEPNAIVRNVVKLLRRLIGEDVELITDLCSDGGWIRADPSQMEQVLMNLAVNARDAMPDGGTLTLRTGTLEVDEVFRRRHPSIPAGRYCTISVTDTGCGMTDDTRAKLFEPFFTTKEPGKGTGLGLSIVQEIVTQIRGHIDVSSTRDVGTTFMIYVPCTAPPQVAAAAPHAESAPTGHETILVVEDEAPVRTLLCTILSGKGYHVIATGQPNEALRFCDEQAGIDLLVTDLVLPHMNGRVLAGKLLMRRPSLKTLFVSGYPDGTVQGTDGARQAATFLQKPFAGDVLLRKVRSVLDGAP